MKKSTLKKPTLCQLFIGFFVSKIQGIFTQKKIYIPKRIGKYNLVRKTTRKDEGHGYGIGLYVNNGGKYFIKTWSGKMKDFSYYSLVNEVIVNRILGRELKKSSFLACPNIIDVIRSKMTLSVIFEYVEGKELNEYSFDYKKRVYRRILNELKQLSFVLTESEKKQLQSRSIPFYVLTLPFFYVISVIYHPQLLFNATKLFIQALIEILKTQTSVLFLTHRDLHPENIKIVSRKIYLLDLESIALTIDGYDLASLFVIYNGSFNTPFNKGNIISNHKFLVAYISLQRSGDRLEGNMYKNFIVNFKS